jgi:hypothetical protein
VCIRGLITIRSTNGGRLNKVKETSFSNKILGQGPTSHVFKHISGSLGFALLKDL